jgi:hypothetical protein
MSIKLSPAESDVLVDIAVRAGMRVPAADSELSVLSQSERRSCRSLARKGLVDLAVTGKYRVNQAGLDRSKQIY